MSKLMQLFVKQFSKPSGLFGLAAGYVMANRASNLSRNEWAIQLLSAESHDSVLEIGPGPGVTLSKLLTVVSLGSVTALDHSATMLRLCKSRNRKAVESGRLRLVEGSYADSSCIDDRFDKILSVNALQFSANTGVYKRLYSWLNLGGKLVVIYQPRGANPTNEAGRKFAENASLSLKAAGFIRTEIQELPLEPVNAFCVLAYK